jgi:Secretion system C-terminal sorting domain
MKKNLSRIVLLAVAMLFFKSNFAQGTLEFTKLGGNTTVSGPTTNAVSVQFWYDAINPTIGSVVTPEPVPLTATFSLRNQVYSTVLSTPTGNNGPTVQGMTFGGRITPSTGGNSQAIGDTKLYAPMGLGFGTTGAAQPLSSMFLTSPTGVPATETDNLGNPTSIPSAGFSPGFDGFINYYDAGNATNQLDANHAVALFNTVEPLFDIGAAKNGRFLYGQMVITFNRPVVNPVVHIGGLGGSYAYTTAGASPQNLISYFTTELELVSQPTITGSTFMAGNEFFTIDPVTNKITNDAPDPNGGSYFKPCGTNGACNPIGGFNNYGAATGSVRVNGVVTELVYNVYVRGSASSTFAFSQTANNIAGATRDPFNGDLYYVSVSLDKPTQQLSGNVFIDRDGLNDAGGGDINKSAGVANPTTNVGNQLYANLIDDQTGSPTFGKVVAVQPIAANGFYLFDNVAVGKYKVQLTTIIGTPNQNPPATQLPAGWVNTGEFQSNLTTVGSDGVVNGISQQVDVAAEDKEVQVNFGIERVPESVNYFTPIPTPSVGTVLTLNSTAPRFLPILSGSDAEDQPTNGVLTNRSVLITTVPTNTQLWYDNAQVTNGTLINNFDPSLLQIRFNQPIPVIIGGGTTQFNYAFVDAAGKADPTPATYVIKWPEEAVPIVLESFDAIKNNCNANIVWKTTSEINTDKFELEVSTDGGNTFNRFTTVLAKGNSTSTTSYQSIFAMQSGIVYYFRLKAIDKSGSYKNSDIRKLSCTEKGAISIVPNPVVDIFRISGMDNGKNTVVIYSAEGKLVKTQQIVNTFGEVSIGNLTTGVYIVNIVNENGTTRSERLVKK